MRSDRKQEEKKQNGKKIFTNVLAILYSLSITGIFDSGIFSKCLTDTFTL